MFNFKRGADILVAMEQYNISFIQLAELMAADVSTLRKVVKEIVKLTPRYAKRAELAFKHIHEDANRKEMSSVCSDGYQATSAKIIEMGTDENQETLVSTTTAQIIPYKFDGQDIQVIQADEIMMTDRQLGEALGYAKGGIAIADLAREHADELINLYTLLELRSEDGSMRLTRVWFERGISKLCMFSQMPKAKVFRDYAADVIFHSRRQTQPIHVNQSDESALARFASMVGLTYQRLDERQTQTEERLLAIESRPVSDVSEDDIRRIANEEAKKEQDAAVKRAEKEKSSIAILNKTLNDRRRVLCGVIIERTPTSNLNRTFDISKYTSKQFQDIGGQIKDLVGKPMMSYNYTDALNSHKVFDMIEAGYGVDTKEMTVAAMKRIENDSNIIQIDFGNQNPVTT